MKWVLKSKSLMGIAATALGGMLNSATLAAVSDGYVHPGSATAMVNGVQVGLYDFIYDPVEGVYNLWEKTINGPLLNPADPNSLPTWTIRYSGLAKYDPFLSYGFSATNNTAAPQDFTFSLAIPIMPTAVPADVLGSLSGSFTDPTLNGLTVTPLLPDADGDGVAELQVGEIGASGPLSNMKVDVGPAFTKAPGGSPTGPIPTDLDTHVMTTVGPYDMLKAILSFRLSPHSDVASFGGFVSINTVVPEPTSVVIMLATMAGLGLTRRV